MDQWTKHWAVDTVSFWEPVTIIPNILYFQLVYNHGAAYGIFQNQRLFLLAVSGLVIVLSGVFYRQIVTTAWSKWGIACVLMGTIGNGIDRLFLGYVIDFIDIRIIPVFNIADVMINVGVICFIVEMIRDRHTHSKRQAK